MLYIILGANNDVIVLENGELRLSGGHEGLLEVYDNGWGYVCDDYWDKVDSDVACRILGFRRAADFSVGNTHPNYTSNFSLDDVQCTGNETNILDCDHTTVHDCSYYEHIFLTCAVGEWCFRKLRLLHH